MENIDRSCHPPQKSLHSRRFLWYNNVQFENNLQVPLLIWRSLWIINWKKS